MFNVVNHTLLSKYKFKKNHQWYVDKYDNITLKFWFSSVNTNMFHLNNLYNQY